MRATKMTLGLFFLLLLIIVITAVLPRLITRWSTQSWLFNPQEAPSGQVAIVFGAGLWRDGTPSPVLRDRIATAADLYFNGKVEKLLMSGSITSSGYSEPGSMRDYALRLGIPDEDIILDYAGRRTYDTCYRARHIFEIDSAILVTQAFHLPRALYTCNQMGVSVTGVAADMRQYRRSAQSFWNLRETVATIVALWEVHVTRPEPILGQPEPIFPREAQ
jgi:SanA protein